MTQKNKVEVRIAGKDYTLVGIEPEEYLQKIALYIDRKVSEIVRSNSKLSTSMASVLTALNIADDYFKSHENEVQLREDLKHAREELERLREENRQMSEENSLLNNKNTTLQLELAKREAELGEVRNSLNSNKVKNFKIK